MSDEQLPTQEGGADTQPTTDWEQRYKDTHTNWNQLNEQMSRFKSDPNAVLEFLQENHPDLLVDDEEEEDEDLYQDPEDEPEVLTRAEFQAWQREQAAQAQAVASQNQFEADLQRFVGDRELDEQGERSIRFAAVQGDIKGPEDLEKAVNGWFEYLEQRAPKKRPRAPHVLGGGEPSTDVPDFSQMSRDQINKYMAERAQAQLQQ